MNRDELRGDIADALTEHGGLTARELGRLLGVDKSDVNSVLYACPEFIKSSDSRPVWFVDDVDPAEESSLKPADQFQRPEVQNFQLHAWQGRALDLWNKNQRRGIVEAVTGAGKTRLALAAIAEELEAGGRCAVVVPTLELCRQWQMEISKWFPDVRCGELSGTRSSTLGDVDIVIAVVNSASRYLLGLPTGMRGLLIADECHRYGSEKFRLALEEDFSSRLGITATRQRSDGAEITVLEPYFGKLLRR